ncbi:MAG: methylmalonyl Co-A mutase-associated GTPase MeaB [bacterium]|nr:methylmalonyl Co-A mutase-associated GTPase MeaB [bacterium]
MPAKQLTAAEYIDGIRAGNRTILSRAITLAESTRADHKRLAEEIIETLLPETGKSIRIGITGVPGVGKSTFIEAFGTHLIEQGRKLAVLAIDPSSSRTRGSILGDKTRMVELSRDDRAYIRPSPAGTTLGGVARKTRESILLCEAAGFDAIIVETVGVGQSETAVRWMVDFFLLLMLAGAGDELQGIKRGIMEMADLIAITKADGDNAKLARAAAVEYRTALHLFPEAADGWHPQTMTCSAMSREGIDAIWDKIIEHNQHMLDGEHFEGRRREQSRYWMYETIHDELRRRFYADPGVAAALPETEAEVLAGRTNSFTAARRVMELYKSESP